MSSVETSYVSLIKLRTFHWQNGAVKKLGLAEAEMPGLMSLRKEFGPTNRLKGARIAGCCT
jgi:adenosylhomocysteinase